MTKFLNQGFMNHPESYVLLSIENMTGWLEKLSFPIMMFRVQIDTLYSFNLTKWVKQQHVVLQSQQLHTLSADTFNTGFIIVICRVRLRNACYTESFQKGK